MKWLGAEAPGVLALDGKDGKAEVIEKVNRWVTSKGRNVTQPSIDFYYCLYKETPNILLVMIVSYESLRTLSTQLNDCPIGLLLCDEGHRLKNSGNV